MKLVKPGPEREVPRGIIGGSEISWATTGATNIYMAKFRVPAGARSRPHYHADCESALYMLSGRIAIHWGEHLEQTLEVEPGDLLYVPPRETHVVVNLSDDEPADHVDAPATRRALVLHDVELPGLRDPRRAEARRVPVVAQPPQADVVLARDVAALVGGIEGAEGEVGRRRGHLKLPSCNRKGHSG